MQQQQGQDPIIRIELVAAAANLSMPFVILACRRGALLPNNAKEAFKFRKNPAWGWRLSVIRQHRPDLADRCAAMYAAMAEFPEIHLPRFPVERP